MAQWFAKDGSTNREKMLDDTKNPEIVKGIFKEIDKFDDTHKTNYTELRRSTEELKRLIDQKMDSDKVDPLLQERIQKFADDISTRQSEMDQFFTDRKEKEKELQERMDELEKAFKRPGGAGEMSAKDYAELEGMAKSFQVQCMALRPDGAKWEQIRRMETDLDAYKGYTKAFEEYVRTKKDERSMTPDSIKSLSVGSDPDGGYTVTPAMATRIITRMFESDPIRSLASVETITTGAIEWLVDFDQAGWGWEGEIETGSQTDTPGLNKKRIPVHVLYAKPHATQTLLEDSGINVENWLADHVARRFMRGEGAAFVTGDGVGKPRGFLTYDSVTTAGTPEWGKVEQVAMGHASALTADGFYKVLYSLVEYYMGRCSWLMNRSTFAEAMQLKDGNGRYLWQPGLEAGQPGMIAGRPARMSTTMPAVAANALSVALADWQEFYMIVDRLGITVQRDPYTAKPFVEFYTRKRVGGDVINFEAGRIGKISAS
jgi:HK97 family phage major capsid protein